MTVNALTTSAAPTPNAFPHAHNAPTTEIVDSTEDVSEDNVNKVCFNII